MGLLRHPRGTRRARGRPVALVVMYGTALRDVPCRPEPYLWYSHFHVGHGARAFAACTSKISQISNDLI